MLVVDSNDKKWALQAIAIENAFISIRNHIELDLTSVGTVSIAAGVTIVGGRRERGPRLFTLNQRGARSAAWS